LKTEIPKPGDVRAQLERLYASRHFRGVKIRRLLGFVVSEWLIDGGSKLTLSYIGECLHDERLTFEEESDRWGYPKTRANLAHVRNRLRKYYELEGYRDQVIVKLNPGSYAPVIAFNPVSMAIPDLDPEIARLILRAKTAIDLRTVRGVRRALKYYVQIPLTTTNPRQAANIIFIPMAAASIVPSAVVAIEPLVEALIARIKQMRAEPWESIFTEACGMACYKHEWRKALDLFELSIIASQGEASYFWWYTALLACLGRAEEAMTILEKAVCHFSRTNIAARTDLALLQIMSGRFAEAEEHLSASLDFAPPDNPLIACHFALLYEAQDRLDDAVAPLVKLFRPGTQFGMDSAATDEAPDRGDGCVFLNGMFALTMGRGGATEAASQMLDFLIANKAERPATSSVEIAFALIGLGRFDDAVVWLNKAAFEEHDPMAMWFHILPPLRHLHGHRRFGTLLRKLKLPLQRASKGGAKHLTH
jgi:tetratricopeptide (TPR) repeat protein